MAKTVLVIDDDPTQRRLLTAAVEKAGFACRTAPDGETGVAIATDANAGADVVLLDLTMPGLSGQDLILAVRDVNPGLPVVLCTGYTGSSLTPELARLQDLIFLAKPVAPARLLEAMAGLLSLEGR